MLHSELIEYMNGKWITEEELPLGYRISTMIHEFLALLSNYITTEFLMEL